MYGLAQAPGAALTSAEQQAVDAAAAVLPPCYSDALDLCVNPDIWEDVPDAVDPSQRIAPAQCATIVAPYAVSEAAGDRIEAIMDALPWSVDYCPGAVRAGVGSMFVVGAIGFAVGLVASNVMRRRRR